MTVILDKHKLFYAAVPKVACSSLKRMFFEVENGFPYENFRTNARGWYIHDFYPTMPRAAFPEGRIAGYRRLALVREPIKRFLSAYSNRVVHHGDVSPEAVRKAGRFRRLTPNPELDEFIGRLEAYMAIPTIKGHCRPMVDILGSDPGYFHAIYDISRIDAFIEDASGVIERTLEAGRFQTGGPKLSPDILTPGQRAKLEKFYKRDYEVFSDYF